MIKKIIKGVFSLIGLTLGYVIGDKLLKTSTIQGIDYLYSTLGSIIFMIVFSLIFGIIFYLISPIVYKGIIKTIDYTEKSIQKLTASEIIYGAAGGVIALIIAVLLTRPLLSIHELFGPLLVILINFVSAIIGADICVKRKSEITTMLLNIKKNSPTKEKKTKNQIKSTPKVLDTSVIIDGRIFGICETGFIEGPLIIPNFVLDELRHISDSADSLKRTRGRRGLDILNKIQKELPIETEIWEGDFANIVEVDSKLLKLAQLLNGKVITNDYNLNKVAEVQGVPVLNINELSNAIKPVVIPGEEMTIEVIKEGKEYTQGLAYLDDGTMIVVEDGRKHIGETIVVLVTSVLQTAAGRMIFAKVNDI
jgi:uncharacterized protein YacL